MANITRASRATGEGPPPAGLSPMEEVVAKHISALEVEGVPGGHDTIDHNLNSCRFTSGCCEVLSSFMRRNRSLTDLNLSFNWIQDSGISLICKADNDQIQNLRLNSCSLTSGCCEGLCSFLKQNQSLRELDLNSNKIADSGMSEICKADNNQLQKLSSSNCYLTSICCEVLSSFLSRNHSLTELNLSNNPIRDAGMSLICNVSNNQIQKLSLNSCSFTSGCCEVLSSCMRRNRSLTDLDLSFNQIQDSGMSLICKADNDQIQNLRLNSCSLTSGCCEALCSFLKQNQSLRELDLNSNKIADSGMSEICKADNNQLQKLSLNSCSLTSGCCEALCSFLKQNQSLRDLDLNSNKIEDSGMSEICKADNNQLQKLSSNNCYLTSTSCRDLSSFLSRNQSLTELNLSDNPIQDSGMSLICNISNKEIQKLSLNSCSFTASCCEVLSSFMRRNRSLTDLNLSFNQIQDSGISLICKADNDQIQNLSLNSCNLTSGCCEALCSFLNQNQSLRELDLTSNKIENSGMSEICKADNNQLQKLSLNSCNLTSDCCEALCSFLKQNQSLRELDLTSNEIEDLGMSEICKADNNQLQKLSLWHCGLTAGCCKDLASALHTNQTLTELNLGFNKLCDSGVREIRAALKDPNCKLQTLNLRNCDLTAGCCKDLTSVLYTNQTLTELNLRWNKLHDSGVRDICAALKDPNCKLQTLRLHDNGLSYNMKDELKEIERSKPGLIIEL
nr:PREDICTED: ribonuclease inhibitor-like [Latimeria chalumnae]|eukprot:XP_014349731.1 PREDICTED: ribonuclease inhibitor-like [Latimeria chalumnae]